MQSLHVLQKSSIGRVGTKSASMELLEKFFHAHLSELVKNPDMRFIQNVLDEKKTWKTFINFFNQYEDSNAAYIFKKYQFIPKGDDNLYPQYEGKFRAYDKEYGLPIGSISLRDIIEEFISRIQRFNTDMHDAYPEFHVDVKCMQILEEMMNYYVDIINKISNKSVLDIQNNKSVPVVQTKVSNKSVPVVQNKTLLKRKNKKDKKEKTYSDVLNSGMKKENDDYEKSKINDVMVQNNESYDKAIIKACNTSTNIRMKRLNILDDNVEFINECINTDMVNGITKSDNEDSIIIIHFGQVCDNKITFDNVLVETKISKKLYKLLLIMDDKQLEVFFQAGDYDNIKVNDYECNNHMMTFTTFRNGTESVDQTVECLMKI